MGEWQEVEIGLFPSLVEIDSSLFFVWTIWNWKFEEKHSKTFDKTKR